MKNSVLIFVGLAVAGVAAYFFLNKDKSKPAPQNSTGLPATGAATNITLGTGGGGAYDATAERIKAIGNLTTQIPTLLKSVYNLLPSGGGAAVPSTSGTGTYLV
jgi:hypothetical protein